MGGHSSGNAGGPGSLQPAGLDNPSIDEFANSAIGKKYTPGQVALLKSATMTNNNGKIGYYDAGNTMNLTGLVGEYQNWKKMMSDSGDQQAAYLKSVKDAPGRDATILTGPAKTALGS